MLELRGIEKSFASQKALYPIDLSIPSGEFFCLLGPSGCGKTTLLRILAGLELPDTGEIWLDGKRIDQSEARIRPFNTVFQSYALFPHLDVFNNIAFGPRLRRKDATWIKKNVSEMLEMVGLKGFENRWPGTLSGGQAQRVAMARALINEPEVLLLDEPLSALDPQLRAQMQEELRTIQKRSQTTFIMVTHDRDEAMTLSDRLALLNAGRVEQVGTPQELYDRPKSAFVARFFGEVNEVVPGVFVRPEKMQITPNRTIGSTHCFPGVLTEIGFRGTHFESMVRLETGARVNVMHGEAHPYTKDQNVFVSCAEGATMRFQA